MKALTPKRRPQDPDRLSLIEDLKTLHARPSLWPPPLRAYLRKHRSLKELYRALAQSGHPNRGFFPLLHAIYSDLRHAEQGYPPQIDPALAGQLQGLARTPTQEKQIKRLVAHHQGITNTLEGLTREPVQLRPSPKPQRGTLTCGNTAIEHPIWVSPSGTVRTPSCTYRLRPLPNSRTLLRLNAAFHLGKALTLFCKAEEKTRIPMPRLRDRLLEAYAVSRRLTLPKARQALKLPPIGPEARLRPKRPVDRVLTALPESDVIALLTSTEPNLELRAVTQWAQSRRLSLPGAAKALRIAPRTISHWKQGRHLDLDLARLGRILSETEIRQALASK